MSWLSEAVRSVAHGESKAERRARRATELEKAKLRAIGPASTGQTVELQTQARTESPEERRRRLARVAGIMEDGGSVFDELRLGGRGRLLGR
jgi:hypothetical protein